MPRSSRTPLVPVVVVALATTVARALAFSGTELYSDEAYYWMWSRRLAAGYYDHPPAIAWLIRLGAALLPGEAGVRVLSLACGGATVVFAALLARELSDDDRAPLWAALLAASAPLLHLAGALALPDAPLAASYTAAAWLLVRARGTRWIPAGVAVGLALLSKYTAALLAPALVVAAVADPELRRELRRPWPWLGALVALLVFAPCLLWNARHGWISLRFQLHHGFASNATWESFRDFAAGQLGGAGPVVLLAGVAFLVRPPTAAARRAAAIVLVPLAVTVASALRGKVEANWPALVYPALAAAAAARLVGVRGVAGRALVVASVAASAVLLAAFGVELARPRLLAGTLIVERFHGWRDLARDVRALSERSCAAVGCDPARPLVVPANYQYGAELAFYGGFGRIAPALERASQLDLWGERPGRGEPFLVVGFDGMNPAYLERFRASSEGPTERRVVTFRGQPLRTVTVTAFARYAGELARR